jgi:Cd2+/Zn2+-exporting ATPase
MGAAGSEVAINSASIALMNNDLRACPSSSALPHDPLGHQPELPHRRHLRHRRPRPRRHEVHRRPIVAAIMHVAGALLVVFNSFRLVRKGEEMEHYHPAPAAPGPVSGGDSGARHDSAGQLAPQVA